TVPQLECCVLTFLAREFPLDRACRGNARRHRDRPRALAGEDADRLGADPRVAGLGACPYKSGPRSGIRTGCWSCVWRDDLAKARTDTELLRAVLTATGVCPFLSSIVSSSPGER